MKKKLLILLTLLSVAITVQAQTSAELLGKWKLVKWSGKNGKEKDIRSEFKTDSVYQVFKENNEFISLIGSKERKSKWKLSKDNKILTIRSGLIVVNFNIDYFDPTRRVITADQVGTFEYVKVE